MGTNLRRKDGQEQDQEDNEDFHNGVGGDSWK